MRAAALARKSHKWLTMLIAIQAVLWAVSGLYMVSVPIEIIHGDHFVHGHHEPVPPLDQVRYEVDDIRQRYGEIHGLRVKSLADRPAYVVETSRGTVLVDAVEGTELSPLGEETIRDLARRNYVGEGRITSVTLLEILPLEVQARKPPLWQVQFEGWNNHTLYFSPTTGDMVARRHQLWRLFDFVWMFHIMDYESRTDVNNTLLRVATIVGVLATGSGLWLLFYSFRRARRARDARA